MKVDYNNILNIAYGRTQPTIFRGEDLIQINRMIKYRDYYDNEVFKYIIRDNPEYARNTKKEYIPAQIPINYSRKIINKLTNWQFGDGIEINVSSKDEKRAQEIKADFDRYKKEALIDYKMLQAGRECNISGGVAFKMFYDEATQDIRIVASPRIECWLVYDMDDIEKISKVNFIANKDEKTVWKQTFEMIDGACYYTEAIYDVKNPTQPKEIIKEGFLGVDNNLLDFIPVYIIPNMPEVGEVWGLSELEDIIPIIDEICKKYSDSSDALKFEMFAITILMNIANVKDDDIQTHSGALWNLMGYSDKPGDIKKLESQFTYTETLKNHIENLERLVYEIPDVVRLDSASVQGIGNLSGVALKLLFANMMAKLNQKNIIWKAKLDNMFTDMLKIKQIYSGYEVPDDIDVDIVINTQIPENDLEIIQQKTIEANASLKAIKTIMKEMGVENPEKEFAEILEERKQVEDITNNPYHGLELEQG